MLQSLDRMFCLQNLPHSNNIIQKASDRNQYIPEDRIFKYTVINIMSFCFYMIVF